MKSFFTIFLRELKANKWSLLFWCIGIIALIASGMTKYSAYAGAGQSATELINQFPKPVLTLLGISDFELTKASGFFGILFLYIALMGSIHAVLLGSGIIAKEERDRTSEFIFTKPISRHRVISSKIAAGLLNIFVLNLVTYLSSIYFIDVFAHDNSFSWYVSLLMTGLLIIQLVFFFVGTMVAAINNLPKTSASIASSILLITFMFSFLANINSQLDFLKYLTPFKYFDASSLLATMQLDSVYVFISLAIIIVAIITTYLSINKRDLRV